MVSFQYLQKLNDILAFSGVSYELKNVVVSQSTIESKSLTIYLNQKINALDKVVVGRMLTGDLSSDLANAGVNPHINCYDLGILGCSRRPTPHKEDRVLKEKWFSFKSNLQLKAEE